MSSSEGRTGSEPLLVRTTGLRPVRGEGADGNETFDPDEVRRLRERVAELEAELEATRGERDDARQWAAFLDRELREYRDRVEALEERLDGLESGGLLDRLRGLFG